MGGRRWHPNTGTSPCLNFRTKHRLSAGACACYSPASAYCTHTYASIIRPH